MAAFILSVIFVCLAGLSLGLIYKRAVITRVVLVWILFLLLGFLTHSMLLYAAIVAVAYHFRNEEDVGKIFLFLCLLTVMPPHNYDILGLGFWWTSYTVVLSVCFLLPMCIRSFLAPGAEQFRFSKVDLVFLVFVAFQCMLQFRAHSAFSAFQLSVNLIITIILPYLAITRFVKTGADVERVLAGLVIGIGLVSVLAAAETLFHWRLYPNVLTQLDLDFSLIEQAYVYRNGLLRTTGGAVSNPLAYAYLVNISILCVFYFVQQGRLPLLRALPFLTISAMALFFTGARAGLLFLVMGVSFLLWHRLPKFLKYLASCFGLIFAAWILFFVVSGNFTRLDEDGTFQYRVDLFKNAVEAVAASPLVGYADVSDSPAMRRSFQGQGIIDVVNTYLIFALNMGLTGLLLFIVMVFAVMIGLSRCKVVSANYYKPLFFSIFLSTLVYISTTSMIGFMVIVFWVFLALCLVYARIESSDESQPYSRK